jgi:glycosyltransferase involved in cell wall biosynthesis
VRPLSLALLPDYPEERWPSMDLCAEMLQARLADTLGVAVTRLIPPFHRRFTRLPFARHRAASFNFDRLLNRFVDYPRHLRRLRGDFDAYHLCDHSYSQLLHELPTNRCGVFCHDLDTFRCLLLPKLEPRPGWFRRMVRRTLDGFRKAAVVFHSTHSVRSRLLAYGLADPDRLVHAPYGTSPEFRPEAGERDGEPLPGLRDRRFVLHVGSCIPRKRIDVLLRVFAEVRRAERDLELVQVGGEWTPDQRALIDQLDLGKSVRQVRGVDRETIAALARRALLMMLPSEAEGFGLPLIEGLACGAVVAASDLPVLREVGGSAAVYVPVADVPAWADTVLGLIRGSREAPDRAGRLARASRYTWEAHAGTVLDAYRRIAGHGGAVV